MLRQVLIGSCVLFLALGVTACSDKKANIEVPLAMDAPDDAMGYYCGMMLPEHEGPKGQIHLASRDRPIWFTSVHDTVVFTRLPEEPKDIIAIYVHDMGQGNNWDNPDNLWVEADTAWYVTGSTRVGGMGMPEAVPFSNKEDATAFVVQYGGEVARLDDIPDEYFSGLSDEAIPDWMPMCTSEDGLVQVPFTEKISIE